jgi:4-aminobutyrate--pyruvate transaminase
VLACHGIPPFVDEIVTGFGRTGCWFGSEAFDIRPACVTLGKALSSGYAPISAVVMSGEFRRGLLEASEKVGDFPHAGTHAGNPVACAIVLRLLDIFERRGLVEHVRRVAPVLRRGLDRYASHPQLIEVRGVGLAAALEFRGRETSSGAAANASGLCHRFCERAMAYGLVVRGTGSTIILAPPLVIIETEPDELFRRFDRALDETVD